MHSFIAVAIVAWSILVLPAGASASAGVEAKNVPADAIFRVPKLAAQDLPRAEQNSQTDVETDREDELLAAIMSARISEPERVTGVLNELRVESTSHLGRLDLEEWSEMMVAMQSGGVALGSRNKLRLLVDAHSSRSHTLGVVSFGDRRRVQAESGDDESSSRSGRQSDPASAAKQASEQEPRKEPTGTVFGVSGDGASNIPVTIVDCA
jgi:hypothetical protein